MDHIEIDDIKGEYASYFVDENKNFFSCFYINKLSIYNITIFQIEINNNYKLIRQSDIGLESPSDSNLEAIYFFKGISLGSGNAVYIYYTGENNETPTFLFKKINSNFEISNYSPSNVALTEYSFNNDLKYNDIFKKKPSEFFFVSTSINKEILFVAYFMVNLVGSPSSTSELIISYFPIELKKYYNIKILQGLKGTNFGGSFISLAFNYFYCLNEECESSDEENKNTALIFFFIF